MEAVRRLRAGDDPAIIASDLSVAVNSVYMWGKIARLNGAKALKAVPKSGRPLKLGRVHWKTLKKMVMKTPKENGFESELWTLPLIRELIEREFDVEYHEDHLSRFMRKLGFSVQKPMVRARERDEKAIKRFVKVDFPKIEKKQDAGVER